MSQLIIQIIGGLIVIIIASWFGFGGRTQVITHGVKVRKTGKWIILVSIGMVIGGLFWVSSADPQTFDDWLESPAIYGLTLMGYGVIFYIIGKIVAWFQKI